MKIKTDRLVKIRGIPRSKVAWVIGAYEIDGFGSEPSPQERWEGAFERIQKLQDRSAPVAQDAIEWLQRVDLVLDGEIDTVMQIQVIFNDSGEQYDVFELIEKSSIEYWPKTITNI